VHTREHGVPLVLSRAKTQVQMQQEGKEGAAYGEWERLFGSFRGEMRGWRSARAKERRWAESRHARAEGRAEGLLGGPTRTGVELGLELGGLELGGLELGGLELGLELGARVGARAGAWGSGWSSGWRLELGAWPAVCPTAYGARTRPVVVYIPPCAHRHATPVPPPASCASLQGARVV
jgi:hypothetical protein